MKHYSFKNICDIDIFDYINLKENPMYFDADNRNKKYFLGVCLSDFPRNGFVKVSSVQEIEYELRKHPFVYEKNTEKILKYIQDQLYP